eukprot:CAMPEP_0195650514 /NCGR_PEP_ID=MMETSP0815-20121206/31763_1 /TAXON_ID=97485 /ORGANISM="Prymnesium parvum, Strain Texoma1" /LENGTH=136 /DNA_ID=CAMNT_0040794335 /DNA_START=1132 /DNA_END=1539 /DNA_ORIENTATION=-
MSVGGGGSSRELNCAVRLSANSGDWIASPTALTSSGLTERERSPRGVELPVPCSAAADPISDMACTSRIRAVSLDGVRGDFGGCKSNSMVRSHAAAGSPRESAAAPPSRSEHKVCRAEIAASTTSSFAIGDEGELT